MADVSIQQKRAVIGHPKILLDRGLLRLQANLLRADCNAFEQGVHRAPKVRRENGHCGPDEVHVS